MYRLCHSKKISNIFSLVALFIGFLPSSLWAQPKSELKENPMVELLEAKPDHMQKLPSLDELVQAKLRALQVRQSEQEKLLTETEQKFLQAQAVEKRTFDLGTYLSGSIFNSAPPSEYRLEKTEVFLDNAKSPISLGGPLNQGLPRNNEQIYFAPLTPGCHEVTVKATYIRLKNDLISRFKNIRRVEHITKTQAFIAQEGFRVELEIEGFEAQNSLFNLFKGPDVRFNKSVRPNFLPGAPLISMNAVLNQGRVLIDYKTEQSSQHHLIKKSLSIDGLPILVNETHDANKNKNIVFDAPLAQGKHKLSVTLLFAEKRRIGGGPEYNFRLSFDREFQVMSGQTTVVNLIGMPENGFRSNPRDSRYARATSKIISGEDPQIFIDMSCKEYAAQQSAGGGESVRPKGTKRD